MITVNNYQDTVKNLDYSTLPATYWKTHTFIEKASENYTNWNAYNSNEGIKKLMDAYFVKLDEFLQKHDVKPNFKTTTEATTKQIKEVITPIKTTKISVPPTSQQETDEDMDFSFVERIPEEVKFLKRFVAMNGKKKTKDDFLRFINALHRAIVEKKIRKTSPYAKQLQYIQEKLVLRFNEMTKPVTVDINEKTIYEFKNLYQRLQALSFR